MNHYINFFWNLTPLLPLIALLSLGTWLLKNHPLFSRLNKVPIVYGAIIGLTILNTIYHLDGIEQDGCFFTRDPNRPWEEIFFGLTAITLLSLVPYPLSKCTIYFG
ncbi:hypothetical protein [uncultured Microscilla sp.]|uniref:hypothetical protein n=1 Tax=uncultured Microscilla sp. TaxID=432653 RepID=UPI002633CD6F|nr:hypothetical protein [uncultured Microscilla sp.]